MHFLGHSGLQDKYNIGLLTILYIYYAIDSVKRKHFYFCRFWETEIYTLSVFRIYTNIHGWRTNDNLCNKRNPYTYNLNVFESSKTKGLQQDIQQLNYIAVKL
jgi:hypothetical protein